MRAERRIKSDEQTIEERETLGRARQFFAGNEYIELYSDIGFGRHHRHATEKVAELMAAFARSELTRDSRLLEANC